MIKLENTEVVGWEHAIRDIPSRSYRRTKNGRYEAYCSDHSHSIFLGTYDTPEEAEEASYIYRANLQIIQNGAQKAKTLCTLLEMVCRIIFAEFQYIRKKKKNT